MKNILLAITILFTVQANAADFTVHDANLLNKDLASLVGTVTEEGIVVEGVNSALLGKDRIIISTYYQTDWDKQSMIERKAKFSAEVTKQVQRQTNDMANRFKPFGNLKVIEMAKIYISACGSYQMVCEAAAKIDRS